MISASSRDDLVEEVRQELFRREVQWRRHHVRSACEAVQVRLDAHELASIRDLRARGSDPV